MSKILILDKDTIQDAINIANGVYKPLVGFLRQDDYETVLNQMRLTSGQVWSMPIIADIQEEDYLEAKNEKEIMLMDELGRVVKVLNPEFYPFDKEVYAINVYGTTSLEHPGVKLLKDKGNYLVGGKVEIVKENEKVFADYNFKPEEAEKIFSGKGWKKVVAFQTRNVPHRSHEFLQKYALDQVDGLFVQPVIGKKKSGDFRDQVIIDAYNVLIDKYYDQNKAFMGILPIRMYYAGPREAIMHALIRRNYGCTHMIIGRDHAGAGGFYAPYVAQEIFDVFKPEEIGIEILKFNNVHFCRDCGGHTFEDKCDHVGDAIVSLSGTKIRDMIKNKELLPEELIRPEIYKLLIDHDDPFVS